MAIVKYSFQVGEKHVMPASRPVEELRKQAAGLILERLKIASVAEVASQLHLSRQAVYDIKKGKYCPSLALVQKACEVWKAKFTYGGMLIDSSTFPEKVEPPPPPTQTTIFDALRQLDSRDIEVIQTKPMGRALEITLRLTVPAIKTAV
jgi:DNA-binding XRE family transcriptional regulator